MDLSKISENEFFEIVPFNVALIDKEYKIIRANSRFKEHFGEWKGYKCFEACKRRANICENCKISDVFKYGTMRVSDESGIDKHGEEYHYTVYHSPVKNADGKVEYVIEMSTDIVSVGRFQKEYFTLFERVPNYVTIIDKNMKIIRSNKKFRETFGDAKGKYCYEVYKKKNRICKSCPALETFEHGTENSSTQVGVTGSGDTTHYIINTTPLAEENGEVSMVIEIATDITEEKLLNDQIRYSYDFYSVLIKKSTDGIVALNNDGKVQIMNPALREIMDWKSHKKPGVHKIKELMPDSFFDEPDEDGVVSVLKETIVHDSKGNEIPVSLDAYELRSKKKLLGRVAFIKDLRPTLDDCKSTENLSVSYKLKTKIAELELILKAIDSKDNQDFDRDDVLRDIDKTAVLIEKIKKQIM